MREIVFKMHLTEHWIGNLFSELLRERPPILESITAIYQSSYSQVCHHLNVRLSEHMPLRLYLIALLLSFDGFPLVPYLPREKKKTDLYTIVISLFVRSTTDYNLAAISTGQLAKECLPIPWLLRYRIYILRKGTCVSNLRQPAWNLTVVSALDMLLLSHPS